MYKMYKFELYMGLQMPRINNQSGSPSSYLEFISNYLRMADRLPPVIDVHKFRELRELDFDLKESRKSKNLDDYEACTHMKQFILNRYPDLFDRSGNPCYSEDFSFERSSTLIVGGIVFLSVNLEIQNVAHSVRNLESIAKSFEQTYCIDNLSRDKFRYTLLVPK